MQARQRSRMLLLWAAALILLAGLRAFGDDMIPLPQDPFDCHVQRIRRIQSEDDSFGTRTPEESCKQTPGLLDHRFGCDRAPVRAAARIGSRGARKCIHAPENGLRFGERCSRVIQIDHGVLSGQDIRRPRNGRRVTWPLRDRWYH